MKKTFLIMLLAVFTAASFAQNSAKISDRLSQKINNGEKEILVWVYLTDKGSGIEKYFNAPEKVVTKRSLERRAKRSSIESLIDFDDLPVNQTYVKTLVQQGVKIKQQSRWFNAVSTFLSPAQIKTIEKLSFVKKIDIVNRISSSRRFSETSTDAEFSEQISDKGIFSYNYGASLTQMQQINVPAVHDLGIYGQGVLVCVLDAGFNRLTHESFSNMNILDKWDFVNNDPDVGDGSDMGEGSHGTQTLSTIGGFKEGQLIGPAFGADYILAKTENTDSETPVEEDNWVAGIEWADSLGADVSSTSLGYIGFDSPYVGYTWQDMDGNTAVITIAADLAVNRGIVVVNSAGNEGYDATHNTLGAPSDGDSVIAVGAVTSSGTRSSFSSVGNTVDGRIKPDVMAMGSSVTVASPYSNTGYTSSSGTSFSCPLAAGVAALIVSFNPALTPMQVRDIMRSTASNAATPNREYGWGILNAYEAILISGSPDNIPPDPVNDLSVLNITSNSLTLQWTAPMDSSVGGIKQYDIRKSTTPINTLNDFNNADQVVFSGIPAEPGSSEFILIEGLEFSTTYYFALRAADFWENWSDLSNLASGTSLAAPVLAVDPESISLNLNPGVSDSRTITLTNNAGSPSTLDYNVALTNNTFPGGDKIALKLNSAGQIKLDSGDKEEDGVLFGSGLKGYGGPDIFGYEWIDSDEPEGPQYVWEDIAATGTLATDWTPTGSFNAKDEGYAGPFAIGFSFKFYGVEYQNVYASSNGFISLINPGGNSFTNSPIPYADDPNAFISPIWDDLDGSSTGTVHYKQDGSRFIIQYTDWGEYSASGKFTYQVVLYSSGKILVYYKQLTGDLVSSTVGIENHNGSDGLQVAYGASYLKNNLAVKYSSEPDWLTTGALSGTITTGHSANLELTFNTEDLPLGVYTMDVEISSNDPVNPLKVVPVTMLIGEGGLVTASGVMQDGWNLVSVPVNTQNMAAADIFDEAVSQVFGYDDGYYMAEMLSNGTGYWVKYSGNHDISLTGTQPGGSVAVQAGWNMIGGYDTDVPVSSIVSSPAGIVVSEYFGFNSGYAVANALTAWHGYWVKVSQAGALSFSAPKNSGKNTANKYDGMSKISVSSLEGGNGVLYISRQAVAEANFEMPPKFADDVFDVRFEDGTFAAVRSGLPIEILISGKPGVIKISVDENDLVPYVLSNGKLTPASGSDGVYTINKSAGDRIFLSEKMIPDNFEVAQNYPNPFNPSTNIGVSLPEQGTIELRIFDAIGQQVEMNTYVLDAGKHQLNWNASAFGAGVYFYTVSYRGNDGSTGMQSRKMILLK